MRFLTSVFLLHEHNISCKWKIADTEKLPRIGIFLCECGGNIGDAVDVKDIVEAVKNRDGVDTGLRYDKFVEVSRLVENLSGVKLQRNKPIVGTAVFSHESGLVVTGALKVPFSAEAFSPELVGQTRNIVLGKKSGKDSIRFKLDELGIEAAEEQIEEILREVKEKSVEKRSTVTDKEFKEIVGKSLEN